ncbi:uncharacterized protein METZ01_LOCUS233575, partial [marine metagenome]
LFNFLIYWSIYFTTNGKIILPIIRRIYYEK